MHESWYDGDTQLEPAYAFDRGLQIEGLPGGDDVHPLLRSWNSSAFQVGSGASRLTMLGGPGSAVGWHRHGSSAQMMPHGRKRWFFYPLDRYPPGDGPGGGFALSDWLRVVYPTLSRDQRPLECIQLPGDTVYVPEGWYHAVLNLADSVAVAVQNDHFVDRPTEALKGVSLGHVRHMRQAQPELLTALVREARELMRRYPDSDLHARKVMFYAAMDTSHEEAVEAVLGGTARDPFHVPMQYEMAVWLHGRAKGGDELALRTFQRVMEVWDVAADLLKNTRNLKALWILDRYYGLVGQKDLSRHYHARLVDLHSRGIDR
ncbi:unnamed protein product [Prorocentrum cordatum]|uniref:JmjC domain-containing protein n=1 Tax=Prorocentrum cordatum TaxID=2364126 RepID=A0ABN9TER9_9DINO|nr:unnamed protein product [Polarella glacialis]